MHDEKWEFKKFGATFHAEINSDDDLADLSYMGYYVSKLSGEEFYVDRRKGILYGGNTTERLQTPYLVKDGSGALLEPIDSICERLMSHWVVKVSPTERHVQIKWDEPHTMVIPMPNDQISINPETGLMKISTEHLASLDADQLFTLTHRKCTYTPDLETITSTWTEAKEETLSFNATPELRRWFDDWQWLRMHEDEIVDWNHEQGWVDAEYRIVLADNLSEDRDDRSYEYWIPGENHLPHSIKNWRPYSSEHIKFDGVSPEKVSQLFKDHEPKFGTHGVKVDLTKGAEEFWLDVLYACEDYERMADYGKDWWSVGVVVKLIADGEVVDETAMWGIESDSDDSYFDETAEMLAHDIAIRAHERMTHAHRVSAELVKIGRNYKAWQKRRKAKEEKHGTAKQKAH